MSLSERVVPRRPARWITFETDQSRSAPGRPRRHLRALHRLLAAWRAVARTVPAAWRHLRRRRPDLVVSTGSGIALAFLPLARLLRIETHYIESATRAQGPSLTARLVCWPGFPECNSTPSTRRSRTSGGPSSVRSSRDSRRWTGNPPSATSRRGRARHHRGLLRSDRLIDRVLEVLPADVDVVWQTGRNRCLRTCPSTAEGASPAANSRRQSWRPTL